jgi:rRNA maturation endonuclease Nob1
MGALDRVLEHFSAEDVPYEYACLTCETGYDVQHHVCPECGSYSVERTEW